MVLNDTLPCVRVRTISNNENDINVLHNCKAVLGDANSNSNVMKTPHRSVVAEDGAQMQLTSGPMTQQRRRRALGDISNRKTVSGKQQHHVTGTIGKNSQSGTGGLKMNTSSSTFFKPSSKVNFATPLSETLNSIEARNNTQLKPMSTKLPKAKEDQTLKGVPTASKTRFTEYDGGFGKTTRWSTDHDIDVSRSPFDLVPREELEMADTIRAQWSQRDSQEQLEEQRLMKQAYEDNLSQCHTIFDMDKMELDDLEAAFRQSCDPTDIKQEHQQLLWGMLDRTNSWEDGIYDPKEDREFLGYDPLTFLADL